MLPCKFPLRVLLLNPERNAGPGNADRTSATVCGIGTTLVVKTSPRSSSSILENTIDVNLVLLGGSVVHSIDSDREGGGR